MARVPPPSPWKTLAEPAPEVEYLVLLTHLPVRRLRALPKFLNYVRKIRNQLEAGPSGLVGYSLFAQPFTSNYWTLSVWEDPRALGQFIRESPHHDAMEELPKTLSDFRTWRWNSSGSDLPPTWDEAFQQKEQRKT
jgi:hypothetical protein